MSVVRQAYTFTDNDVATILSLGYQFKKVKSSNFKDFMNRYYKGFNLASLLEYLEQILVPLTALTVTRLIAVENKNLHIKLENEHLGDEVIALVFERLFHYEPGNITVYHKFFVIPLLAQANDLGRKILKASLQQYINMRLKVINVTAGLSIGPYVWAKYGFVATKKSEVKRILAQAKARLTTEQYTDVQAIYDNYYTSLTETLSLSINGQIYLS